MSESDKPPLRDVETVRELAWLMNEVHELRKWLKVALWMVCDEHDDVSVPAMVKAAEEQHPDKTVDQFAYQWSRSVRERARKKALASLTPEQREALGVK